MSEPDLTLKVAVLEERIANANRALEKQATEYERRLGEVNHHLAVAKEKDREYLPRSVYEKSEDEHDTWRRTVSTRLDTMAGRDASKAAMLALTLSILGMLIGLTSLILRWPR
jgi:hypothetical protein